jgi:hypothetical protein
LRTCCTADWKSIACRSVRERSTKGRKRGPPRMKKDEMPQMPSQDASRRGRPPSTSRAYGPAGCDLAWPLRARIWQRRAQQCMLGAITCSA